MVVGSDGIGLPDRSGSFASRFGLGGISCGFGDDRSIIFGGIHEIQFGGSVRRWFVSSVPKRYGTHIFGPFG